MYLINTMRMRSTERETKGGQNARAGNIIIRQRGTKFRPGMGVAIGNDHTIYALKNGKVEYKEKKVQKHDGRIFREKFVNED